MMTTAEVQVSNRDPSLHGLADAERDRDGVGQQRHPEPERDRDRQLLLDQGQDRHVAEIALAEIEPRVVPQHDPEALDGRLVEAELRLQLLDESRIEALRATIFGGRLGRTAARLVLPAAGKVAAATAGDPRRRRRVVALKLRQHALHRTAGRELNDDEGNEHDPEQCRDHQKRAAGDIGEHAG